jgi:hypothetical protein
MSVSLIAVWSIRIDIRNDSESINNSVSGEEGGVGGREALVGCRGFVGVLGEEAIASEENDKGA